LVTGVGVDPGVNAPVAVQSGDLVVRRENVIARKRLPDPRVDQRLRTEGVGGESAPPTQVADGGNDQERPPSFLGLADRGRQVVAPLQGVLGDAPAAQSRRQREQQS
jgi:hypothetical protein